MIIPLRGVRLGILLFAPCRVIQMWRDPEEIRQSQNAYYTRNADAAYIRNALCAQKDILEKEGVKAIGVQYRSVLDNPEKQIKRIAEFINAPNPIVEAIKIVKPDLIRFKKERLQVGV